MSWEAIAQSVGVVGDAVPDLARAVKAGLVQLLLDGLDEVGGRYRPEVIQEVVRVVRESTIGEGSLVALSGRTTEGLLLGPDGAYQRGLELPDIDSEQFRIYTRGVIDAVVPGWPALAGQVPEPQLPELPERPFTDADREAVTAWVLHTFADVGKDRSLFFVQSLACLARTRQLDGNKPLYVRQPEGAPKVAPCLVSDACRLAASLACVREQQKVTGVQAEAIFTPVKQLDVATWFAVLASAEGNARNQLPQPNHLIAGTFDLDPIGQTEEMTQITRQMQKHALLYSTGAGMKSADWQPAFLSDWIRAALLVRA